MTPCSCPSGTQYQQEVTFGVIGASVSDVQDSSGNDVSPPDAKFKVQPLLKQMPTAIWDPCMLCIQPAYARDSNKARLTIIKSRQYIQRPQHRPFPRPVSLAQPIRQKSK